MAHRILVVDDDRQIVRLVQSYLQQAGFTVLTAYDGEEALHAMRREKPDLVVLDLMLPQRDGLEITRLVRSDEALAAIPILMLTARVEDVDKLIGLELGADDYLTKPFNPPEVVARVKAILRRSSGALKPPAVVQIRGLRLDLERHTATIDDRLLESHADRIRPAARVDAESRPGFHARRTDRENRGVRLRRAGAHRR